MITATIDKKPYQVVYRWGDLTLGKFIELSRIPIPEKLAELYTAGALLSAGDPKEKKKAGDRYREASEAITPEDMAKEFPAYYGKVIGCLSDIPPEVIDHMDGYLRADFYNRYLRGFVLSLIHNLPVDLTGEKIEEYNPPEMDCFEIEGEKFMFPKSLKIGADKIPMAQETILTFSEASDIDLAIQSLRDKGVEKFPLFMAVYCRKEGERYDEKVTLQREALFHKVRMDVAWSLFFCIAKLTTALLNSSLSYSRAVRHRISDLALSTSASGA